MLRRIALATVAPAFLLLGAPAEAKVPAPQFAPEGAIAPAVLMSEVVTKTNQRRAQYGCDPLAVDHDLTIASIRQSLYMARTGRFTHVWADGTTFVARSRDAGYEQPAGENIAWGYQTADDVMDAWMHSESHRDNILDCRTQSIGTGVAYSDSGLPYYTETFGWD